MGSDRSNPLLYFLIVVGSGVLAYTIYKATQEKQEKEAERVPLSPSPKPKQSSRIEEDLERLWTNLEAWVRVVILPKYAKKISGIEELETGLERLFETAVVRSESFQDAMKLLDELKKKVVEYLETGMSWSDAVEKAIQSLPPS